jgi:hypothetical protein
MTGEEHAARDDEAEGDAEPAEADEQPAFERLVVGPVGGPGIKYLVCLEDALVFVPQPWVLMPAAGLLLIGPMTLPFWLVWCLFVYLSPDADLLHLAANPIAVVVALGLAAVSVNLYRTRREKAFRQYLSRESRGLLKRAPRVLVVRLNEVRALRTNPSRLLVEREGRQDLIVGSFRAGSELAWALKKAYPGVWAQDA